MEINLPNDWTELLQLLSDHEIDYVVIGAFALAMHGISRMTGDIDIFFNPSEENSRKLLEVLREFGVPIPGLSERDLSTPNSTISFGRPPNRIDLLNWLSGTNWDDVASDKLRGPLGKNEVWYISRRAYVKNKIAAGRTKDLADVQTIREMYPEEKY